MHSIQEKTEVLIVTTDHVDEFIVEETVGLVTGSGVIGANFVKDFFARVTDFVGGRSRGYENALAAAHEQALTAMALQARKFGANAVLGVRVDISAVGTGMMMAACAGTAVRLAPRRSSVSD